MNEADLPDIRQLFADLIRLTTQERSARLAILPAALQAELRDLLSQSTLPGLDLDRPPPIVTDARADVGGFIHPDSTMLPSSDSGMAGAKSIGPYRVIERLGEGGMGMVYKAEQRSPIRRTVAVKVIKLGYDSAEVIARFESERQALARMEHLNIAKVLDAGTDERGRPYFVMEYVPGLPITKYADENRLPIKDRLELMAQVCDAIGHAHSKAIIHRDIKAGNVLAYTTAEGPRVKVIDFGVAKALTGDRLTDHTFNTISGQAIGTYESMSPEQADGLPDIDTRTDVYSLGVLLYELLSGGKPFDRSKLAEAADHEIRRIIREVDPPKPSTRLSSLQGEGKRIATARQAQVESLTRLLKSELDWIPLMAMRKQRERRYRTPQQMADDIRSYIEGKPLIAAPDSAAYRLNKFARRNRGPIAASATVLLVLLLGIAGTTMGMIGQGRARAQAERATTQAIAEKQLATEAKTEAENERARALQHDYVSTLAAASSSLDDDDIDSAVKFTQAAPPELRGWEWSQLNASLDLSTWSRRIETNVFDEQLNCVISGDGSVVAWIDKDGKAWLARVEELRAPANANVDIRNIGWTLDPIPPGKKIYRVQLSRDGSIAAVSCMDSTFGIYDAVHGRRLASCVGHRPRPARPDHSTDYFTFNVTFSPDNRTVATTSDDGTVALWSRADGSRLATLTGPANWTMWADYSPDSQHITAIDLDGKVWQWSAPWSAAPVCFGKIHGDRGVTIRYSPDGKLLASTSWDHTVVLMDAGNGRVITRYLGHRANLYDAVFSPDGSTLASISADGAICLWNTAENPGLTSDQRLLALWHGMRGYGRLAFDQSRSSGNPPRPCLYSFGTGVVNAWEYVQRGRARFLTGHTDGVNNAMFSPDGTRLASTSINGEVRIWSVITGECLATLHGHQGWAVCESFSSNGKWIVTGSYDHRAIQWDADTGQRVHVLASHQNWLVTLSIHPDSRHLLTKDERGIVKLWDLQSGAVLATWPIGNVPHRSPSAIRFSPSGNYFVTGLPNGNLGVFDWKTGSIIREVDSGMTWIHVLNFSPDGTLLIAEEPGRIARVWRTDNWQRASQLEGYRFSTDNSRVFSNSADDTMVIWNTFSGTPLEFMHTRATLKEQDLSPDGHTLAACFWDRTIRLWDDRPVADRFRIQQEYEAAASAASEALDDALKKSNQNHDQAADLLRARSDLVPIVRIVALDQLLKLSALDSSKPSS